MPSDPSYGTTGFFSYLWTRRNPVYDASQVQTNFNYLTDENGVIMTDENGVPLTDNTPTIVTTLTLVRWD